MEKQKQRNNKIERYSFLDQLNENCLQYKSPINQREQQKNNCKIQEKNIFKVESKKSIQLIKTNGLQDFIKMLQNIEETIGENGLQYLNKVQEDLERLKLEYPNLKKLLNLMFPQHNEELKTHNSIQESKVSIYLQNSNKRMMDQKNLKSNIKLYKKTRNFDDTNKKIIEFQQLINEEQQKNKLYEEQIQKYKYQIISKDADIRNLQQNIENIQIQMKKKDEIFQQTLREAKNISANALEEIAIKLEIKHDQIVQVEKVNNDKLLQIKQKEKGIKEETFELNQTIDEYLIMFKQNPQSQEAQKKKYLIQQKSQHLKNQIQSTKSQLENFINSYKPLWGQSKQTESHLKQQIKNNLELMQLYQKIFDNFYNTITQLLDKSQEYQQNNIVLRVKNNSKNISISLENESLSNKFINNQQVYANIKTEENDITLLKDNQSQTIIEDSFDNHDSKDECQSRNLSPIKKKKNNCLSESKLSIYRNIQAKQQQYIDPNN
ncbi:unnamed protein product [Paramecium sonneborni]|uniref:Uncharacterized protein n=1 Tax=Paramecium sonneborni TaxID=65129 RepID=A0A8S1R115_9CILI|nr:unnamed protein product [Paramecium sonneborni]